MTPEQIRDARETLGFMWGLGRPLRMTELGRALRFKGRDPGEMIAQWESGQRQIGGPAAVALEAMLAGYSKPAGEHWR